MGKMGMSRGGLFVAGYSVVLLALFCIFCYLMSTVNPNPLEKGSGNERRFGGDIEDPDDDELITDDDEVLGYGLEKATEEEKTGKPNKLAKLIPLYRSLLRKGAFVNSSLVSNVVPPVVPSELKKITSTTQKPMFFMNTKSNLNASKRNNTFAVKYSPVKGFRRSVNDIDMNSIREDGNSGVILKIVDDNGRSRIEIKLGPNGLFQGNTRHYRSSENKVQTDNLSNVNAEVSGNESTKNTVIKILPNNTMVFEEIDHNLVSMNVVTEKALDYNKNYKINDTNSSGNENQSIASEKEANFEEIILLLKSESPKNVSSNVQPVVDTEMYTFKMLIDNETKAINQFIKKASNVNITSDKYRSDIFFDKKINITDLNNTKSDLIVENEKTHLKTLNHTQKPMIV